MTFVKSADDKLWEGEGLVPDLPRVRAPVHQRAETGMQNARVYGVPKAYAARTSPAMTDVHRTIWRVGAPGLDWGLSSA